MRSQDKRAQDAKASLIHKLESLIEEIKIGDGYLTPEMASQLRNVIQKHLPEASITKTNLFHTEGWDQDQLSNDYGLNEREMQVARGLIAGKTYQQISDDLFISINTVRHYVKTLYKKMGVKNKIQLFQKIKGMT